MNFKFGKSVLATAIALGALLSGIVGTAGMPAALAVSTQPATKTVAQASTHKHKTTKKRVKHRVKAGSTKPVRSQMKVLTTPKSK
ncbi:MAG: hypothetical protein ABI262_19690 [Microcoleus sp.]